MVYLFFRQVSQYYNKNNSHFLSAYLAYTIYLNARNQIKQAPVITLTKTGIETGEKDKAQSFLWQQIREWRVEKDGDNGYNLHPETDNGIKK